MLRRAVCPVGNIVEHSFDHALTVVLGLREYLAHGGLAIACDHFLDTLHAACVAGGLRPEVTNPVVRNSHIREEERPDPVIRLPLPHDLYRWHAQSLFHDFIGHRGGACR